MKQKLKTYNQWSELFIVSPTFHSLILSPKSIISIHPATIYPAVDFSIADSDSDSDSVAAQYSDAFLPDEFPAIHWNHSTWTLLASESTVGPHAIRILDYDTLLMACLMG